MKTEARIKGSLSVRYETVQRGAKRLKAYRESLDIKKSEFNNLCGYEKIHTYPDIERGASPVTMEKAKGICTATGWSLEHLCRFLGYTPLEGTKNKFNNIRNKRLSTPQVVVKKDKVRKHIKLESSRLDEKKKQTPDPLKIDLPEEKVVQLKNNYTTEESLMRLREICDKANIYPSVLNTMDYAIATIKGLLDSKNQNLNTIHRIIQQIDDLVGGRNGSTCKKGG